MKTNPLCPHCGHNTVRNGKLNTFKAAEQRFRCSGCGREFSTFTGTVFHYQNSKPQIVAFVLELICQFGMTYSQTKLFVKRWYGIDISRGTFSNWRNKLGGLDLQPPGDFTEHWHVDEMFIRHEKRFPDGKDKWFDFLWVVCDSKQQLIAVHLSKSRDSKSARTVLKKAKERAGFSPAVIVSDDCNVYPRAVRAVFRKAKHFTGHIQPDCFLWKGKYWEVTNNQVESLNSRLRDRLRRLRGYKTFEGGQRFMNCLAAIWNGRFTASLASALLTDINK